MDVVTEPTTTDALDDFMVVACLEDWMRLTDLTACTQYLAPQRARHCGDPMLVDRCRTALAAAWSK